MTREDWRIPRQSDGEQIASSRRNGAAAYVAHGAVGGRDAGLEHIQRRRSLVSSMTGKQTLAPLFAHQSALFVEEGVFLLVAALSTEAFVNVYLKCQDVVAAKRAVSKICIVRLTVRRKVNGFPASSNISKAAVKSVVLLLPGLWTAEERRSAAWRGRRAAVFCCSAKEFSSQLELILTHTFVAKRA